jgi:hypothetical protein
VDAISDECLQNVDLDCRLSPGWGNGTELRQNGFPIISTPPRYTDRGGGGGFTTLIFNNANQMNIKQGNRFNIAAISTLLFRARVLY